MEPRPAPVHGLRDSLRGLWQLCRSDEASLSRALTMNLVVVAPAAESAHMHEALDRLLRRLPCRAFLVLLEPGNRTVTAEVSGATRTAGSACEIVLEQIALHTSFAGFAAIPGIVRPLLVNDLPSHLFWAGRLPDPPDAFEAMLSLCEHAVVDSAMFLDPGAELSTVSSLASGTHQITDLSWLRTRPWRRALAQAFEHLPWRQSVPTDVTIRHGLNAGAEASSLLLGTWLQQRLHAWIDVQTGDAHEQPTPDSIELQHGCGHVSVTRADGQLRVAVSRADSCLLPFLVPDSRGGQANLLAAAIDMA
jgi:glucose-6-phosphate dehydrogenase assembly protein OpcA